MIATGLVFYFLPDLFGQYPDERFFSLMMIEALIGIVTVVIAIPLAIVGSLIRSEGRSICYSSSRYKTSTPSSEFCSGCLQCSSSNCGFSFLIIIITLLFSKK